MPKKDVKRKGGRYEWHRRIRPRPVVESEDDSYESIDGQTSVGDLAPFFSSDSSDDENEGDEVVLDEFEEGLIEKIEGLTQKSAQGRTNCLLNLSKSLLSNHVPSFVSDRHSTICYGIKRCLKKGAVAERSAAAELASIVCVQLGAENACKEVCNELKPVLLTTASDAFVAPVVRGKCCQTLALICFIAKSEMGDILSLMRNFETFFSGSFFKDDGTAPTLTPEIGNFHAAALSAWGLLLTTIKSSTIVMMMQTKSLPSIGHLAQLLESQHLEVRMTAGDVLALLYEIIKFENEGVGEEYDEIVANLRSLATDSHKYRAKKDRKEQKASFRDILSYVEDDVMAKRIIKFYINSLEQFIELDTWAKRIQYDSLCSILGPGIHIHLAKNDFLRDLYQITDPIPEYPRHDITERQKARKKSCCQTLALICFIAKSEMGDILSLMRNFETFFSGSFFKDDGTAPTLTPEIGNFHAAALSAWGLLLTTIKSSTIVMMMQTKSLPSIGHLAQLLESQHLEVRMTAGDVLALLYEIIKFENEGVGEEYDEIVANLRSLATDSHKYRAKKDRKEQKASFRDILSYVEDDVMAKRIIKFYINSLEQFIELDTWAKRIQYDSLCSILGPGIHIHLAKNDFLRDLYQITDPIPEYPRHDITERQKARKKSKNELAAIIKARTICRGRDRYEKSGF